MSYLSVLVDLMQQAGQNKNTTGKEKKEWVLTKLREVMNLPDAVEDLIVELIDLLIDVDKHRIVINPNVKTHIVSLGKLCC